MQEHGQALERIPTVPILDVDKREAQSQLQHTACVRILVAAA
jgi:hypothetical protein